MKLAGSSFVAALPFWSSLITIPLVIMAAMYGGWYLALPFLYGVASMTLLDALFGKDPANPDAEADAQNLFWHRAITLIWMPIQLTMNFGILIYATQNGHLARWEEILLMLNLGLVSGGIGIVYAHELIHRSNRLERSLGEILMTSVLYGHFVTEHLVIHHRYVATPHDPATARYNESFYRFFARVVPGSFRSSLAVENARLTRIGKSPWALANPFWRYIGGALAFLAVAYGIAGWTGVGFYVLHAFFAVWQLEQINYIEHYGLRRQKNADGKYEPVRPRHSWNAEHKITNFLFINLQRHSDHHAKPNRRFPDLQSYGKEEAPHLPFSYPLLTLIVYHPWLWRRMMNPKVKAWRAQFYPEITDWKNA